MKYIKSTVNYRVPNWNFCNVDRLDIDATPSKQVCQFCIKERSGHRCALYNQQLMSDGVQIKKLDKCCRATAGYESVIESVEAPTIQPKDLMKATIELYNKTVNDLLNQGYPRQIAEQVAKTHVLGGR